MVFDQKGLLKLYECSSRTKKLQFYKKLPPLVIFPLTYLVGSNIFSLYAVGFKFFTFGKILFELLLISSFSVMNTNLRNNCDSLVDKLYLQKNGTHVRTTMMN